MNSPYSVNDRPAGSDALPTTADIAPATLRAASDMTIDKLESLESQLPALNVASVRSAQPLANAGPDDSYGRLGRRRGLILGAFIAVVALLAGGGFGLTAYIQHVNKQKQPASSGSIANISGTPLTADSQKQTLNINFDTQVSDGRKLTATGQVLIQNENDSTSALTVQNAAGNDLLVLDTVNNKVGIGAQPAAGGAQLQVKGDISTQGTLTASGGGSSLSNQGLTINGVLVCTAAGCSTQNGPNLSGYAQLAANQTFSGINSFTSGGNVFKGDGSGLSALNAGNVSSGTLSDNRLSGNVALLNANQTFTATDTFNSLLQAPSGVNASGYSVGGTTGSSLACGPTEVLQQSTFQGGLITGGNCVTIAGGTTPTLQQVYDASTPATITLSAASGPVSLQDAGTPLGSNLFQVTDNSGATKYFAVSSAGISISGNANITGLYEVNGSQISSANLSNDANLAKLNANQTFTGSNTFTGTFLAKNASNSTSAFEIQNAAGTSNLFIADTTNTRLGIGKAPTQGTLDVNGAIYQNGSQVCDLSGNCAGVAGIGGSGTTGTLPVFTGSGTTIGNSNLAQSGSTVTATGNLNVTGQYQVSGSQIASSNLSDSANLAKLNGTGPQTFTGNNKFTGTVLNQNASNSTAAFQIQNALGTSNLLVADTTNSKIGIGLAPAAGGAILQVSGNVDITGLYSVNGTQISSANLSNDANLAKLNANQTFSGNNTFSSASNSFTGSGSGLTSLNASNVSSGTLSDSRLSANVALLNGNQTFSGNNTFSNAVTAPSLTTSGASLGVGATTASLNLQGNLSSSLAVTNGTNTITVGFSGAPIGNITYNFDNTVAAGTYTICTSIGNCAGVGGGVTTVGGTTNKVAKFTSGNSIGDSIITDNGSTVTIGGTLGVNTITPTATFTVGTSSQTLTLQGDGGTTLKATSGGVTNALVFATPSSSNKTVTIPNASGTVAVSASGPLSEDAAGNLTCPTCLTSGGGGGTAGVSSINTLTGGLTLQGTIHQINVSSGGTTITLSTPQDIDTTSNVSFGSVSVTGTYQVSGVQISSANLSNDANLAKLNANQTFSGNNTFSSASNSFTGSGSGLTSLNASNVSSGTLSDSRLSANVALLNGTGPQTFTGNNKFTGTVLAANSSNSTSAFQIQNASAADLLNVDTSTSLNLLANGDFEGGTVSGWNPKGASTLTQDSSQAWQGNNSLKVATTTAANDGAQYSYAFGATTQYTLSLYAKVASGSINDFNIGRQDNGSDIDCLSSQTLTTSWTRFSCSFTTGGTISGSNIYVKKTGASAENIFIDGVQLQTGGSVTAFNAGGALQFGGLVNSPITFQNKSDSTTAFQIQNSAGTSNLLVADTINGRVGIGKIPSAGVLDVNGAIYQSGHQVCDLSGNCAGVAGIGGSGTVGTIPVFTGSGTSIGDSTLTQSGSTVTATNLNVTGQYEVGGVQIATSNLSDAANIALLGANQTFSGNNTFSSASNSFTGNGAGLSSLNASSVSSGTLSDSRLSANVALLNGTGPQTFTGNNKFTGTVLSQNSADSTTAFQIQNNAGTSNLFIADTTHSRIAIAQASASYTLDVGGDINTTTGFRVAGTPGSSVTCTSGNVLQNAVVSGGIITGGTCVANGGGTSPTLSNIYNNGSVSADQTLALASAKGGGVILQDAASTVGNLFTIQNNGGSTNYLNVTNAGISVAGTVVATGVINSSGGAIQTNGTTRIDNSGSLLNIGNISLSGTISGGTTITSSGNINTTGGALQTNSTTRVDNSGNLTNIGNLTTAGASTFTASGANGFTFKPGTDNTAAFQIQNNAGTSNLFVADTTHTRIAIGQATANYTLDVAGDINTTTGFRVGGTPGSTTTCSSGNVLQNAVVSGGIITGGTCVANGGGYAPTFNNVYTNGSSSADETATLTSSRGGIIIQDASTPIGADLFTVQSNGAGSKFLDVTSSGVSVAGTVVATGNINTSGGALQTGGTTRIDNSGNLSNIGNISLAGTISGGTTITGSGNINSTGGSLQTNGATRVDNSGNLTNINNVDITGSLATQKGTDFSTTGSSNNVNFGNVSLVRLTGASAQTITGIANGRNGYTLTIINAGSVAATITNNDGSSLAANRITTGTGGSVSLPVGGSVSLIYDSTAALWRVTSGELSLQNSYNNSSSPQITLSSAGGGLVVQDASSPLGTDLFTVQSNGAGSKYLDVTSSGISVVGTATVSGNINTTGGVIQTNSITRIDNSGNLTNIGNFTASAGSTFSTTGANGFIFKPGTDNTAAFQIQNAASSAQLLNVDSTNGGIITLLGNNSGALGAWQTSANALAAPRNAFGYATANGFAYVIGGRDNSGTTQSNVYYAAVNANGGTGVWNSTSKLPTSIRGMATVTVNGYVYAIAGRNNAGTYLNSVYRARIGADGTLGGWLSDPNTLPSQLYFPSAVVLNGYMYVIGGQITGTGNSQSTVFYAKINADGTVNSWIQTTSLPAARDSAQAVTANGQIYILGGDLNTVQQTSIYHAAPNSDGSISSWTAQASNLLPSAVDNFMSAVSNGYLYVIGGPSSSPTSNYSYASLNANSNGDTGAWTTVTGALPAAKNYGAGMLVNGYIYAYGGTDGVSSAVSTIYYAKTSSVQAGGSLDLVGNTSDSNLTNNNGGGQLTAGDTRVVGTLSVQGSANLYGGLAVNRGLNVSGGAQIKGSSGSTNILQVQNAGSDNVLTVSTVNLIGNGNFEGAGGSPEGWSTKGSANIGVSSIEPEYGSNAMIITASAVGDGASYNVPLKPSTQYTLSFWVGDNSGTNNINFGDQETGSDIDCATNVGVLAAMHLQSCTFTTGATISGTPNIYIKIGSSGAAGSLYVDGVQLEQAGSASNYRAGDLTVSGSATFTSLSNSTTAFQIQTASGVAILTADTKDGSGQIQLGTASSANGLLVFNNSAGAGTATITLAANPSTNYTYQLPTSAVSSNQCLESGTVSGGNVPLTFANCSATPTLVQVYGAGASQTDETIGLDTTRKGILIRDNATPITGTLFGVQNSSGATKYLDVTATGITVAGTITATGAINTSGGSLQTNGTQRIDLSGNILNVANITLSAAISGGTTYSGSGNINTTGGVLQTNSTTRIDNSGNLSNIGTYSGSGTINTTGGAIQTNSTTRIDNSGNLTNIGNFTASAGSTFATTGANGFIFKPGSDVSTAFQIQNAGGTTTLFQVDSSSNLVKLASGLLTADASNNTVGIGATTTTTKLLVNQTAANDILDLQDNATNVVTVSQTGQTLFKNASNSNTAFRVQDSSSNPVLSVDTTADSVTIANLTITGSCTGCSGGASSDLQSDYNASATPATITLADAKNLVVNAQDTATDPSVIFNLQCTTSCGSNGQFDIQNSGTNVFSISPNGGAALFENSSNSTTAFQIQTSGNVSLFTVDTTNSKITLGNASSTPVLLVLGNKNTSGDPTGTNGAIYYNSNTNRFRCYQNGSWINCIQGLVDASTSIQGGDTLGNIAVETNFATNYSIPANSLIAGQVIRVRAAGVFSTGSGGSAVILKIKMGSTTVCANVGTAGWGSSASNWGWSVECYITVDSTGVSGALESQGSIIERNAANGSAGSNSMGNNGTITVDTTSAQTLQLAWGAWGTSNASNSTTLRQLTVEVLGP